MTNIMIYKSFLLIFYSSGNFIPSCSFNSDILMKSRLNFLYNKIIKNMGGTESFVDTYIRTHGMEGLSKLILLQKKLCWLQQSCTRQISRKIDDEIKYILFQIDELINDKKILIIQSYQQTKTNLVEIFPYKVKKIQEKNARLLENIYGRNQIVDKLNSIKISFHIQIHMNKKKVKKSIEQKIANIQNNLLYQTTDIPISKQTIQEVFIEQRKQFELIMDNQDFKKNFEEFKSTIIMELDFDRIFWPSFDRKIRQAESQIDNIHIEAQNSLKKMKYDVRNA